MNEKCRLHNADCLDVLETLEADSIDAIVQDPPAGIGFMGREWDSHSRYEPRTEQGQTWAAAFDMLGLEPWERGFATFMAEVAAAELRVAKPGAHSLTWALPRTSDLTTLALRLAGWEIRDTIVHLFGQGFPKSHDVSKAIDKLYGATRDVVGVHPYAARKPNGTWTGEAYGDEPSHAGGPALTAPATDDARQWEGWGTALSPGHEVWVLARKPLAGTVAKNVLAHGTGAINVDGCRTATSETITTHSRGPTVAYEGIGSLPVQDHEPRTSGRWPKNALLSCSLACDDEAQTHSPGCPVAELDAQSGTLSGGASRFFPRFGYYPKASDRKVPGRPDLTNKHPTHKHPRLMSWLVRLVTPPGGIVLDPFMGSGTTGVAALSEGARFIGIEREMEHFEIASARINAEGTDAPSILDFFT